MSVHYPFGRTVTYVRDVAARRPKSVDVSFFSGLSWTNATIIDDIHWKPFGGLEYYRMKVPSAERFASVDYREGQTTASVDLEVCPTGDSLEDSDQTGRARALVVKRGQSLSYQARTTGEHVFSSRYTYSGKELSTTASCLLSGTEVLFDGRSYGQDALGLTTRGIGGVHTWGGRSYGLPTPLIAQNTLSPWEEFRTIVLDQSVSEWTGFTPPPNMYREIPDFEQCEPDCVRGYRVESVDPITNERQVERRTVDENGQVVRRRADWGSTSLWSEHLEGDGQLGGLSGVYRWVSNESGTYEYFYDADNRRRIKTYASGAQDEFFFRPASTELLSDVGNSEVYGPQTHPTDDYVWLGGMPVAVVRGRLNAQMQRMEDHKGDCGRNGASITPTGVSVGSSCGVYFPVNDPQGRIALVLDSAQRVSGVGESDPYGSVNQIDVAVGSDHPYSPYFQFQRDLVHGFKHTKWASDVTAVRTRLHYFAVDVESSDDSWLEDSKGQTLTSALERCSATGSSPCGEGMGRVTTFWAKPDDSYAEMHVRFRSGPQTTMPLYGVSLDRIEYLRSEKDARPWWPPLRLPGQYLDEETGLFENWNRFYDPEVGRYLSPEPMLGEPEWVISEAREGHAPNSYGYARNSPIQWIDPTGRATTSDQYVRLRLLAAILAGDWAHALYLAGILGGSAPIWVQRLQMAFDVANRTSGPCFNVANNIFNVFQQMGRNPQIRYLLTSQSASAPVLSQRIAFGNNIISTTGIHVVVEVEGVWYDAFTGPAGMAIQTYLNNVGVGMPQTFPLIVN
jgi:RHS repeat-associated protein